jgi:hypothetical protein
MIQATQEELTVKQAGHRRRLALMTGSGRRGATVAGTVTMTVSHRDGDRHVWPHWHGRAGDSACSY